MLGLRTSPRRWQEHLSKKLKEHSFIQDERDPCLFVEDMLAVGPSDATKNVLEKLVTDKPQEFLRRGVLSDCVTQLCKDFGFGELKGSNTLTFEKVADSDAILDQSGQHRHRQLLGGSLWLDRPDIKNAVYQLSTHVGTVTTRDEINIKRLLRYLVGNLACNMIVGCNRDVPGIAGTAQGSICVGDDRCRLGSSQVFWHCCVGQGFC